MHLQEATNAGIFFGLAPWVVLIPLIGMGLNLVIGTRAGNRLPTGAAGVIASLASGLAFVVAVLLAYSLAVHPEGAVVHLADWIVTGGANGLQVGWDFRIDTLSVTMMLVVAGVGTLIHIYAIGYMREDVVHNGDPGRYRRFFVYLNLFIAAMMVLVSADNFLMLFVGWEGVGLCSYLLIGFWFEKGEQGTGNAKAAKKAFVVNRIGDFGLLIALFLIYWHFGSLEFEQVFAQAPQVAAAAPGVLLAITLFMLLGVTGKSAQLPLYVWLPDAMAGPTPVSALIHAATMVTAGVYLVARSYALYVLSPAAQGVVAWVGGLTALFAATIAVGQFDIKKVLAYSTISQLGFMVAAVGMGAFVAGMFHLVTHAFFKALLFLAAGSVIQGLERGAGHDHAHGAAPGADPQDMRQMGGLRQRLKWTWTAYLIGALALAGIFPLSGFFSKDEILAEALRLQPGVFALLLAAAFLTAFYIGRQLFLVFTGSPRSRPAAHAQESPAVMTIPLAVLAFLSVVGGALNLPGILTLEHWLEHTIEAVQPAAFSVGVAGTALLLAAGGLALAWALYTRRPLQAGQEDPLRLRLGGLFTALARGWGVDEIYQALFVRPYQRLAVLLAQPVDLGFIDALGSGLGTAVRSASSVLRRLQTGFVRSYALAVLAGAVAIVTYFLLR
jgi:NADH-quinone oxidoreductase subunit L